MELTLFLHNFQRTKRAQTSTLLDVVDSTDLTQVADKGQTQDDARPLAVLLNIARRWRAADWFGPFSSLDCEWHQNNILGHGMFEALHSLRK